MGGKLNKEVLADSGKCKQISMDSKIDLLAMDAKGKNYILGECKFRNSEVDIATLDPLKEKSSVVKKGAAVQYILFSKSGFTKGLRAQAKEDEKLILFSLSDPVNG